MSLFDKLARRTASGGAQSADAPPTATPAGIGSGGGARDVQRTLRTHTGQVPTQFIAPVEMSAQQRKVVAMAASVLLRYPGPDYLAHLAVVDEQAATLPLAVASDFIDFTSWARGIGGRGLEEHYVETFDQRRRCSLFLSYYAVGDTRQRGMAILSFREQLESLGFSVSEDELADHLCVILEAVGLSEGAAHERAVELLASHRQGLEVLRAALTQLGSPYASLIIAVCKALPEVDADTAQKYVDLIRTGPPAEMVGIADLPFPTAQPDFI
ncbi:nitrate reductase molybdenum cofactor assembly chaperone [Corynebacterium lizhenjunii]|uniref:Nitrate reductase molybdenum cofactor assembly chaperone n=1 Tax=Corynebacterium lizhenjunii TaxID=2709394 RepID=A0A7T0PCQ4_9CORY|nr:nitrate reductase molybdenum cofactor assembly chaperone [Corynebacterium lizhenjunii]QPK79982.1 nitrate reductase molybdenum cofactor assembly chaperone [Corynebacterium lizhenjunii]